MPIMVVYRATGVDMDAYAPYEAELQKTPVPPEALLHQVGIDGKDSIVIDVWDSRLPFEAWTDSYIKPMLAKHGIAYVEPQVFDVVALATHDGVDAFKALTTKAPELA